MTLKELLKDKQLPLRVRLQEWDKHDYFEVVSFNEYGTIGYSKEGYPRTYPFFTKHWELYQEPKQKTVLHEYLVASFSSSSTFVNYYLKSDEEFSKEFSRHPIIKTGLTIEVELP